MSENFLFLYSSLTAKTAKKKKKLKCNVVQHFDGLTNEGGILISVEHSENKIITNLKTMLDLEWSSPAFNKHRIHKNSIQKDRIDT